MADLINFTIDGQALQAPQGTLLINAAKSAGISIPAFCYYDGLSLQAACRMCLVEVEKTPKLQVACTLPVAEMVREMSPRCTGAVMYCGAAGFSSVRPVTTTTTRRSDSAAIQIQGTRPFGFSSLSSGKGGAGAGTAATAWL